VHKTGDGNDGKTNSKLKLAYMGTPDFSIPALTALIKSKYDIRAVYTQPPRPAGRGQRIQKTPVHNFADEKGIPVRTPISLKTKEAQILFSELDLDVVVVAAYGLILPIEILEIPRLGCINIHASLLPRWRGAAPIQRAIMAGDNETGVCIMLMNAGLDTGPVLSSERTKITQDTTATSLHDTLASLGAALIGPTINAYAEGLISPITQKDEAAVYATKLSKKDEHLNWSKSAPELVRVIRALAPSPGAWSLINGHRVKVYSAEVIDTNENNHQAGEVLSNDLIIACGRGILKIKEVKKPGKNIMPTLDYLRGNPVKIGDLLE
jgi:methionyl-tRNA formyltransferase